MPNIALRDVTQLISDNNHFGIFQFICYFFILRIKYNDTGRAVETKYVTMFFQFEIK